MAPYQPTLTCGVGLASIGCHLLNNEQVRRLSQRGTRWIKYISDVESTRFISKTGRKIFGFSCSSDRRRSIILSLLSSSAVRSILFVLVYLLKGLFLSIFSFSRSLLRHRSCSRMDPSHPEIMDVITITFPTNIVAWLTSEPDKGLVRLERCTSAQEAMHMPCWLDRP